MGNVYGISQPWLVPTKVNQSIDTACPAGTKTAFFASGTVIGPGPGSFTPLIIGMAAILLGATPATALVLSLQVNGGADVDTITVQPALLVANATIVCPFAFVGNNSGTAWVGAGSSFTLSALATTQPVTVKQPGTWNLFHLIRGIDTLP